MTRLLFLSALLFLFSCKGNTAQIDKSQIVNYQTQVQTTQQGSLLAGIQYKIYTAFVESLMSQSNGKLEELSKGLAQLYKDKNQNIILY
ncbi:hypothetical protein MNBD_BACTEROID07-1286, partial [hydrothermal vent metagenome]